MSKFNSSLFGRFHFLGGPASQRHTATEKTKICGLKNKIFYIPKSIQTVNRTKVNGDRRSIR